MKQLNDSYYDLNRFKEYLNEYDLYLTNWEMYKLYKERYEDTYLLSYLDYKYMEFKDNINNMPMKFKKKRSTWKK